MTQSPISIICSLCTLCGLIFGLATSHAVAAQRDERQLNFLVLADWGDDSPAQRRVARAMARWVEQSDLTFDAVLVAGDNFYGPLRGVDDPAWQTLFEEMYDPDVLDMPFYIVLGNHDYEGGKDHIQLEYARVNPDSRWKMPDRRYRLDLPEDDPLVTILMLDSNRQELTDQQWQEQIEWLDSELSQPRADWTLAVAHHQMFSNGAYGDNGVLKQDWGTLFERHAVDFYICGHEHDLQHLEIDDWHTSFIISGGGGARTRPMRRDDRGPFSRSIPGFAHLQLTPEQAHIRFINMSAREVHSARRDKAGPVHVVSTTGVEPATDRQLRVIQGIE